MDQAEAVFTRRPELPDAKLLHRLAGTYETPTGVKFQVILKTDGNLYRAFPGGREEKLLPYKGLKFHVKDFSDELWEFAVENEQVKALKHSDPSGVDVYPRK
jgi:hypothetical protein